MIFCSSFHESFQYNDIFKILAETGVNELGEEKKQQKILVILHSDTAIPQMFLSSVG